MCRSYSLVILFLATFSHFLLLQAQEPEKDWLEFYYTDPKPEEFVSQMKKWAEDGTLENVHAKPALIAFTSQLIRQNREKLQQWYTDLAGLTPIQSQVLHTAMLFSRTKEADSILHERFGQAYAEQKRETQKILEMPLDKVGTIDMLWGYYYATGSAAAIRRIVICFRFIEAPERPPGVDVPEGYVPLYKILPDFAHDSLLDNAKRHPHLVEILKELFEKDESLIKVEQDGVYDILSTLDPKSYPPRNRSKQESV